MKGLGKNVRRKSNLHAPTLLHTQIVLTSHSPYIVDELEADEVWLLATDEEGVAQARRLSDHPDAERALEVLTTGEFWSAEGEDWVVADEK